MSDGYKPPSAIRLQFQRAAKEICSINAPDKANPGISESGSKNVAAIHLADIGSTKSYAQVESLVSPPISGALKRNGNTNKRPNPLTIRLTEKQKRSIRAKAQAASITVNQYAKAALLGSEYRPPLGAELHGQLLDLYRELTRHGNNLNQIARRHNIRNIRGDDPFHPFADLRDKLKEAYAAIGRTLSDGREME